MLIACWLLVCAVVSGLIVRRLLAEAAREREEAKMSEPFDGLEDIGPTEVLEAIGRLADVPGVKAVYTEPDSNVVWVLAEEWLDAGSLGVVKEDIRYAVPIGLSARVVQRRTQMPDACAIVARGWGLTAGRGIAQ